jgi:hypothetical protein
VVGESSPLFGAISATRDSNGNLAAPVHPGGTFTASFAYDQLNRMTGVYQGSVATGIRVGGYSYNTLSPGHKDRDAVRISSDTLRFNYRRNTYNGSTEYRSSIRASRWIGIWNSQFDNRANDRYSAKQ